MPLSEAERYTCSVFPGTKLANLGNLYRESLICCSAASDVVVHQKLFFSVHPLRAWKRGRAFSADLEMKQLSAVNLPFSPWASHKVFGEGTSMNSSMLVGLGWIPFLVMQYPRNWLSSTPKVHFHGFSFIQELLVVRALYDHIVDIKCDISSDLFGKNGVDYSLIGRPCIFRTERHFGVAESPVICVESCFLFVLSTHQDLMVPLICIQEALYLEALQGLKVLVDFWQRVVAFGACFFQIKVINAHAP